MEKGKKKKNTITLIIIEGQGKNYAKLSQATLNMITTHSHQTPRKKNVPKSLALLNSSLVFSLEPQSEDFRWAPTTNYPNQDNTPTLSREILNAHHIV